MVLCQLLALRHMLRHSSLGNACLLGMWSGREEGKPDLNDSLLLAHEESTMLCAQ